MMKEYSLNEIVEKINKQYKLGLEVKSTLKQLIGAGFTSNIKASNIKIIK